TRFSRDWSSDVCSSDLIGRALRAAALIELVGSSTRDLADATYPDRLPSVPAPTPDDSTVLTPTSGVLILVDHDHVVRAAQQADRSEERRVGKEGGPRGR